MADGHPLTVAINAQLPGDGSSGGIEVAVSGLIAALGRLPAGDLRYQVLTARRSDHWMSSALPAHVKRAALPVVLDRSSEGGTLGAQLRRAALPVRRRLARTAARLRGRAAPASYDAWLRQLRADLIHFPYQDHFPVGLPSIYNPWDLQHLHLPEFFSETARAQREVQYRAGCLRAQVVIAPSAWTRRDLTDRYGLSSAKIAHIPVGPGGRAGQSVEESVLRAVRGRLQLEEPYAFYPAYAYPHKNHLKLFEALALLRDKRGLRVPLICSGRQSPFQETLAARLQELNLEGQVRFLGYVSPVELQCLYRLSRALVFPTRFEGFGQPVLEAFAERRPVVCSTTTSLPELAGNAAVFFDPGEPGDIADAVRRVWTDPSLRDTLVERGRLRLAHFDWSRIAMAHQAVYRAIAGRPIPTAEAEALRAYDNEDLCRFLGARTCA
jgi:glycosyltransferase involved in cell wall biosynthesis